LTVQEKLQQLSVRQMSRLLKRLALRDNDILLIRRSGFSDEQVVERIRAGVENLSVKHVLAVLVDDFSDLQVLNQQEMNSRGWYHRDQFNKLVSRKPK